MKSFKELKFVTVRVFSSNMPLHLNIASGAMSSTNIAPLDFLWITFKKILFHHRIFVIIVCNSFMTALVANDTLVALTFV